jgi:hypothetical protein
MKPSTFVPPLVLLVSLAIGSFQGTRLTDLREAEAFYRWILAAATQERLFEETGEDYQDARLFKEVSDLAEQRLAAAPSATEGATADSALVAAAADSDRAQEVWQFARSQELQPQRGEFLTLARDRKLQFAQDIQYVEAIAGNSGVNVFNLFLGFRKIAANLVWLEVDRYWHGGQIYLMIPLMKTCVALDPQFIDAYLLGAWHLAYNATAQLDPTPQPLMRWDAEYQACMGERERFYYVAIDFLKNGIRNNPRNYKLYFDLGYSIYENKLEDHANAVKYLKEAVRLPHDRWVPRQLYIAMERNGQYEEALAGWKHYQTQFAEESSGKDTAPRFIRRNEGLMEEQQAKLAAQAAEAAADPAAAEASRQASRQHWAAAREIWSSLSEPFSQARLLRIQAAEYAEEGRYHEAIGLLDKARWDSGEFFEEASDLIIEYKQLAGLPLTVSEQKAVIREAEGTDTCPGMPTDLAQQALAS